MDTSDATQKALAGVNAACLNLGLAANELHQIRNGHGAGVNCACGDGRPCAYHAGLIENLDDVRRRAGSVVQELQADVKNPDRKV